MFTLKYAFQSIKRRKKQNLVIVLAIVLSVSIFMGVALSNQGLVDTIGSKWVRDNNQSDIHI